MSHISTIGCLSGQDQPLLSIEVIELCFLTSVGETNTLGVSTMTELQIISIEVSIIASLSVVETMKS
jgi:hypothetical protein